MSSTINRHQARFGLSCSIPPWNETCESLARNVDLQKVTRTHGPTPPVEPEPSKDNANTAQLLAIGPPARCAHDFTSVEVTFYLNSALTNWYKQTLSPYSMCQPDIMWATYESNQLWQRGRVFTFYYVLNWIFRETFVRFLSYQSLNELYSVFFVIIFVVYGKDITDPVAV